MKHLHFNIIKAHFGNVDIDINTWTFANKNMVDPIGNHKPINSKVLD